MTAKNQFVRFRVGKESFGIDIGRVQEIFTVPEITRVPDAPDYLEGVINLRGKIVSVMDLRKRLGLNGSEDKKKNRILVTELAGKVVGLIVDEVSEVLRLAPESIEPPPELITTGAEYITGVGKLQDGIVLLLDLEKVFSSETVSALS